MPTQIKLTRKGSLLARILEDIMSLIFQWVVGERQRVREGDTERDGERQIDKERDRQRQGKKDTQ